MASVDRSTRLPGPQPQALATGFLNPERLRLVARCWIVMAIIAYVVQLFGQTRDGLTDGIRTPFGGQRSVAKMPKQGSKQPWRLYQNYALDIVSLRFGRIDDGVMRYS